MSCGVSSLKPSSSKSGYLRFLPLRCKKLKFCGPCADNPFRAMGMLRSQIWNIRRDERGFTLPEVLITIVLMGIVFAIASSTWFGTVESRRVDSATNQLAADLRLAHTSATNQLNDYQVVVPAADSSTYQIGPSGGTLAARTLPDGTVIAAATTIVFKSSGAAEVTSGAGSPITIKSSTNASNDHAVEFNTATSRIRVVD